MICFWICIFDISNTPPPAGLRRSHSCDLLLNLYLWHIKHTQGRRPVVVPHVVICFWICIFDISNTPGGTFNVLKGALWFAFEFVSLTYQTHLRTRYSTCFACCDLLLNLYLWHIKHTIDKEAAKKRSVVICFWICIFDISNTPGGSIGSVDVMLWFAFEFVSLTYQTHHNPCKRMCISCLVRYLEIKNHGVW